MKKKKKPDQVADNPGLLPYGSNVGAPSIKPTDITPWKEQAVHKTNKYFNARYEEIKEKYRKLIEEYNWNELVFGSKIPFPPIKGHVYHLYQNDKESSLFISIIAPDEWNQIYIGSFRLNSNDQWEKVEYKSFK